MKDPWQLLDILYQVFDNPMYKPRNGTTYCNLAVYDVLKGYGCKSFPTGLMANGMFDYLSSTNLWGGVGIDQCQELANKGALIVASEKGKPHGHICVIRPGLAKYSTNWKINAPSVMNVGRENFISKGLNFAFRDIPKMFIWKENT